MNGLLTYMLEFLVGQEQRKVAIQAIDAANGVVLEEIDGSNGMMRGLLLGGSKIEIPIDSILKVDPTYRIGYRASDNGSGARHEYRNERQTEQILDERTDPETGEVKGVASVEEKGNPDNKVERVSKGWRL